MRKLIIIFFIGFYITTSVHGNTGHRYLTGKLVTFTDDGFEVPMPNQKILIQHTTLNEETDDRGVFRLNLNKDDQKYKDQLQSGRKITLLLHDPNWFILTPFEGKFFLPKNLDDYEMKVRVAFNGSKVNLGAFNAVFTSKSPNSKKLLFAVQVMSTDNELNALKIEDRFKQYGFKSSIDQIKGKNGVPTYKVFSGIYRNRHEAGKELKRVRDILPQHKDAFLRLILK